MTKIVAALVVVTLVLGLLACIFPVYRDRGFIDMNTGSKKGYREWCIGGESRRWYQASALEQFMEERHPKELNHNWVSYQGDGKNILGVTMERSHGSPGMIMMLNYQVLAAYLETVDDSHKKALYDLLSSGDQPAIGARISEMDKELSKLK